MSYFLQAYFNAGECGAQNINAFAGIQFFNDVSQPGTNYEHLFQITGPPSNSLYNLNNLKVLVDLGTTTPNICQDPTLVFDQDFTLTADWTGLATSLGLPSSKHAYMLWLWASTAYTMSLERVQDGGNLQTGKVGTLAAESFYNTMTTMQLELPLFTWASQFNISYATNVTANGQTCSNFYTTIAGFPQLQADALCADTTNTFNFVNVPASNQGYFQTTVALSTVWLYGNQFDPNDYFGLFMSLTGWEDPIQIAIALNDVNAPFNTFMNEQVGGSVYSHYSTVDGNICDSQVITGCSFSNLTYN